MAPSLHSLAGCVALLSLAGCSSPLLPGLVCTAELRSTITVEVVDAMTDAAIPVGATVIVRGAAFYDSVVVASALFTPRVAYVAWENNAKEGRYTVEVRKPGYMNWIDNDVRVPGDRCHSGPGPLVTARLQPRP